MVIKLPDDLQESDIKLCISQFPSGCRDFGLVEIDETGSSRPLNPLDLLVLDRAADLIEQEKKQSEPKAMNLALCRLLASSIVTERVGRHLIVEEWSEAKVRGETLGAEIRSDFAQVELSCAQADKWRLVTTGKEAPQGSLAELMWDVVTDLPALLAKFDDPDLGAFSKKLHFHLVPAGEGRAEFNTWSEINSIIKECRIKDFEQLGLPFSLARLRELFRKYMAVMVRWTSKMTGQLAREVIDAKLGESAQLTDQEATLLDLRYGASPIFGKINVGYLLNCGPLFTEFFNDVGREIANDAENVESASFAKELLQFVYLQRHYLELRKYGWMEKKAERREMYADKRRLKRNDGQLETPDDWEKASQAERREMYANNRLKRIKRDGQLINSDDREKEPLANNDPNPSDLVAPEDEWVMVNDLILPELERRNPHDAKLLRHLIAREYDFDAAAKDVELTPKYFKERLMKMVLPAVQQIHKEMELPRL